MGLGADAAPQDVLHELVVSVGGFQPKEVRPVFDQDAVPAVRYTHPEAKPRPVHARFDETGIDRYGRLKHPTVQRFPDAATHEASASGLSLDWAVAATAQRKFETGKKLTRRARLATTLITYATSPKSGGVNAHLRSKE